MRRLVTTLLTMFLLALTGGLGFAADEQLPCLAPYVSQTDFLFGTPSVAGDAVSGLVNPAAWKMLPGSEMQFFWTEPEEHTGVPRSWSLAIGGNVLGFGVTHWKWEREPLVYALGPDYAGEIPNEQTMTDYTIALALGDTRSSVGLGYQWSKGETWERRKDKAISTGFVWRPSRYLSFGGVGAFAFHEGEQRWSLDAGVRPFGTSFLTLFGDAAWMDDQDVEDAQWSAGVVSEILPGLSIVGKTRKDDPYSWGILVSLGTLGISAHPQFDSDGDHFRTTYGVRAGARRPTLGGRMMGRGKTYLSLDMKGQTRYRRYRLFDRGGHTLTELLRDLEEVRSNDCYGGVALNLSGMSMNMAVLWELREKLREIRWAGKKVVIFVDYATMGSYYLASVADRIVMDPEGGVMLLGMGAARTYMKKMLEKMGLAVEEWRFFKYKSAAEGYSREEMSEADREQRQALLDDFYSEMREGVSKARGFDPARFDSVVNHVMIATADSALALGLVDELARWSDLKDQIKDLEGEEKGIVGPKGMAFLRAHEDLWGRPPRIGVIYGLGVCAMDEGITARRLGGVIKSARENREIKAVVFRADSPGGEIIPSDIVAEELKMTSEEKPVIVSQGWVAGSGGYWISMYGDKILATPFTITGSIGVIGLWIWNEELGDKLGLSSSKVTVGDHADILLGIRLPLIGAMIPDRNLTPSERGKVEREILGAYEAFLMKVAAGRNMTRDEIHKIGEGRIWSGRDGLDVGLVDEIGGMEEAIAMARERAGIPPDREVELVELPEMGLLNPDLFKMPSPFQVGDETLDVQYLKAVLRANGRPMAIVPPDLLIGSEQ